MSRAGAKYFLAGYFLVFMGAVFLRVDYFPFSWVPMYGMRDSAPLLTVPIGDLKRREMGFKVTHADGDVDYLSRRDLNIPPANFRRLYYERAFGKGPPQHLRERAELMAFNRWWYDTLVGPDPLTTNDYQRQILDSMNRSLGYAPSDPKYIVKVEADSLFARFKREDRDRGDLSRPILERWHSTTNLRGTLIERTPIDAR